MVDERAGLVAACGEQQVRAAAAADAIVGVAARWVVTPGTTAEVASVLRCADEHGLAVVPRGAATKMSWAAAPSAADVVLDTARLSGLSSHVPGDLVATVGAGTPLRAVQAGLAPAGQRLALDVPAGESTVGGVLATGEAGPLRLRFGSGRDLLIGVEFVRADGVVARAGGQVVKNVAGYDLGKLLCGSYGTLGVITSATFRLHPRPAARRWVCRPVSTALEARDLVVELLATPLSPVAVEVDLPAAAAQPAGPDAGSGGGTLAVLLEGTADGVAARTGSTLRLLGAAASTMDTPPVWWGRYPFGPGDIAVKLAVPRTDLPTAVRALREATGQHQAVRGSVGTGVLFAALPAGMLPDRVAAALAGLRAAVAGRGSAVVLSAPPAVRDAVDLWGPVPGLGLMRRVKQQFDPGRSLSPGRFVGGL